MKLLQFVDGDGNSALHFGCKNGNRQICDYIVQEADEFGKEFLMKILERKNNRGFTPLMELCFKGYMQGEKDVAM